MPFSGYPDKISWSMRAREWRHNPCLMRPASALVLILFSAFWIVVAVLKFPSLVLGILMSPVLQRFNWVIEFWYPTAIGKWLHLTVVRLANRSRGGKESDGVNHGFHSRSTETRVEIARDRVYVHPLPQLLDNLGYLVVCLPSKNKKLSPAVAAQVPVNEPTGKDVVKVDPFANANETMIVAFVVDCGDANAVVKHVKLIRKKFYGNKEMHVQAVLSTHKHHDHTAGNKDILDHPEFKTNPVKLIFGGAVEKVPFSNYSLANGDKLPLPRAGENRMDDVVEVEAVATPAHTRGSLTYVLRARAEATDNGEPVVGLFTGDTMFSAGGGVAFEADIDPGQDDKNSKMTANSYINASAAGNSVERCFAEVLYRSFPVAAQGPTRESLLVFPGHEYTNELLSRQLTSQQESCKWRHFSPAIFFETMSQMYISQHRRTLPHSSGRLLNVPSSLERELTINPQLRSLKQRGGVLLAAIRLWNRNFARNKVAEISGPAFPKSTVESAVSIKERATETQWNIGLEDVNRKVFTTLYADDLDGLIKEMSSGSIDTKTAARRLEELKSLMDKPVIGRRPIPGTLPSSKNVYRGLLAFALLGSAPSAATLSDSVNMKMAAPIDSSSDRIRVSKKRLIAVLHWLGLCDGDDGLMIVRTIHQLWKETQDYTARVAETDRMHEKLHGVDDTKNDSNSTTDVESMQDADDEVVLGALKWIVYGIPERPKESWFSYCTPCSKTKNDDMPSKNHPAGRLGMKRHGGELVRHDVLTCPLCRNATGCPVLADEGEEIVFDNNIHKISSSSNLGGESDEGSSDDAESSSFGIEVAPVAVGHVLQEF